MLIWWSRIREECSSYLIDDVHITTSAVKMRSSFATLGLWEIMVTDNDPGFMSMEFARLMLRNGIWHVTTAPYHPASNGLAEWAVQTVKEGLRKMVDGPLELDSLDSCSIIESHPILQLEYCRQN